MMAEVHKLTERLLPGEADPELVEALRDLLARAERGEINGLAWAGCSPSDSTFNGWQGAGGTMFHIAAAILCLQSRYAMMMQEEAE